MITKGITFINILNLSIMKNTNSSPKWATKANLTIQTLKAKKEKSSFDWVRLINAQSKIEDKSLSKVFKRLNELTEKEKIGILGKSKFPSFKDFQKLAPKEKEYFSFHGGLMLLRKFNKVEKTQTKVKRQNANQLKKVA